MTDKLIEVKLALEDEFTKHINESKKAATQLARSIGILDDEMEKLFTTELTFRHKGTIVSPKDVIALKAMRDTLPGIEQNSRAAAKALDKVGKEAEDTAKGTKKAANETKKLATEQKKLKGSSDGVYDSMKRLRGALAILGIGIGVREIFQFSAASVKMSAEVEAIEQSFTNMVNNVGGNVDRLLYDMNRAALGTVQRIQLMKSANIALASTGEELVAKLPKLMEIARVAALQTGQSIEHVFATLITGIARGEPRLIDNANIYIKIGAAVDEYAASIGKATDALDQEERRIATANAVIAEAPRLLAAAGDQSQLMAVQIGQVAVGFTEAKIALGEFFTVLANNAGLLPKLAQFLYGVEGALQGMTKRALERKIIEEETAKYVAEQNQYDISIQDIWLKNLTEGAGLLKNFVLFVAEGNREFQKMATGEPVIPKDAAKDIKEYAHHMALLRTYGKKGGQPDYWEKAELHAKAVLRAEKERAQLDMAAKAKEEMTYYDRLESRIDGILLGAEDIFDDKALTEFRLAWLREITKIIAGLEDLSSFESALILETAVNNMEAVIQARRDALAEEERLVDASLKRQEKSYDDMVNAIERILTSGLDVTEQDLLDTEAGIYEDKPMEVVRQLDAIAKRGQAEIDAHPEWAIYIPAEIRGDEAATMAWARTTADEMRRLVSPEFENLMDLSGGQERTVAAYAQMLQDEANKKKNIQTTIGWLVDAGYGRGTATQAVEQAFGVDKPEIEAKLKLAAPDSEKFIEGVTKQIEESDVGAGVFKAMSTSFVTHEDLYINLGNTVGGYFYTGFTEAISENSENFQDQLITYLLPGIIAALPTGSGGGDLS